MWTRKHQAKYMACVEDSHRYGMDRTKKLRDDAALDGCIRDGQYFLIMDAIEEAFRYGAICALEKDK